MLMIHQVMQPHATFTLQLSMMYHGLTKLSDFLLFFTFGIGFVFGPYTYAQIYDYACLLCTLFHAQELKIECSRD